MLVSHRTTLQTEFVMENEGKWRKQKVLVLEDVCPLRWIESSPEEEEEDGGVLIMELNMAQCTQSPEHQTCPGLIPPKGSREGRGFCPSAPLVRPQLQLHPAVQPQHGPQDMHQS